MGPIWKDGGVMVVWKYNKDIPETRVFNENFTTLKKKTEMKCYLVTEHVTGTVWSVYLQHECIFQHSTLLYSEQQ